MSVCMEINVYVSAVSVTWKSAIGASKTPAESLSST